MQRKLLARERVAPRRGRRSVDADSVARADTDADAEAEAAVEPDPDAQEQERARRLAEVTLILDDLEQRGWLSDVRTADALLLAKAPRYGSRRLRQLLQAKSLDASLVSDTLARARDTEFERARALWQRRFGQPPADLRERDARQQRFLAGRGFDASVIDRVLKGAPTDD